ncbi:MAG: hypothetical protein HYZ42_10015, partial [Bacteroidetes bacterium]|nr:hypothetical protein [Bacteroidota bacterium]
MKYFLLFVSLALCRITCQSQTIITDKIAESFLRKEYHSLYQSFIDSLHSKKRLYMDYGFNQLKYDSVKKQMIGISNEEKNNERIVKEYILNEDNIEFSFKLNKSSTVSENLEDLVGVNISTKDKKETVHFAIFQTLNFTHIFSDRQKRYLANIINHVKLYDTKLYSKYTKIDSKSYIEYGHFIVFTVNIRLRNSAINGRVKLYNRPSFYYDT